MDQSCPEEDGSADPRPLSSRDRRVVPFSRSKLYDQDNKLSRIHRHERCKRQNDSFFRRRKSLLHTASKVLDHSQLRSSFDMISAGYGWIEQTSGSRHHNGTMLQQGFLSHGSCASLNHLELSHNIHHTIIKYFHAVFLELSSFTRFSRY